MFADIMEKDLISSQFESLGTGPQKAIWQTAQIILNHLKQEHYPQLLFSVTPLFNTKLSVLISVDLTSVTTIPMSNRSRMSKEIKTLFNLWTFLIQLTEVIPFSLHQYAVKFADVDTQVNPEQDLPEPAYPYMRQESPYMYTIGAGRPKLTYIRLQPL